MTGSSVLFWSFFPCIACPCILIAHSCFCWSAGHVLSIHHLFCCCPVPQVLYYHIMCHTYHIYHSPFNLLLACSLFFFLRSSQIIFWPPRGVLHVSLHSCDNTSHLGHPNLVRCSMWSSELCPINILCVHGLPSSLCTATVDPVGRNGELLWVPLYLSGFCCFSVKVI